MSQSRHHFLLPVSAHSLLGHYIKISVLQLNKGSLSDWLAFEEPLIVQRIAFASAQSNRNYFLPLSVAVKSDSAFIYVIVIVPLCLQFASLWDVNI